MELSPSMSPVSTPLVAEEGSDLQPMSGSGHDGQEARVSDADSAQDGEAAEQAKSQEEMLKVGEWAIIKFYFQAAGYHWLLPFLGSSVAFITLNRCAGEYSLTGQN